jgi:hypothetical protein
MMEAIRFSETLVLTEYNRNENLQMFGISPEAYGPADIETFICGSLPGKWVPAEGAN